MKLAANEIAWPICLGYLATAGAFGVLAAASGVSLGLALLMSFSVYAGTLQFMALGLLASGASPMTLALTSLTINARYILLASSLSPSLPEQGTWLQRWIFGLELTDETYAYHSARLRDGSPGWNALIGVNLTSHIAWILGTAIGYVLRGSFPGVESISLDFALSGLFVGILVEHCERRSHVRATLAGVISYLVLDRLKFGNFSMVGAGLLGAGLGWHDARHVESG